MTINRTLLFALSVTGGAVVAAMLAMQRNEKRLAAVQLQHDLQVWEDETGSFGSANAPPVV